MLNSSRDSDQTAQIIAYDISPYRWPRVGRVGTSSGGRGGRPFSIVSWSAIRFTVSSRRRILADNASAVLFDTAETLVLEAGLAHLVSAVPIGPRPCSIRHLRTSAFCARIQY